MLNIVFLQYVEILKIISDRLSVGSVFSEIDPLKNQKLTHTHRGKANFILFHL